MARASFGTQDRFDRYKPTCHVGVLGHQGHGKTSLTAAIVKCMAARKAAAMVSFEQLAAAPEPMVHVCYEYSDRRFNHIDFPGHADVQKNVITGVAHMDGAILVVSATEGVMPQTLGHVLLARHYQLPYILVFLNKVDLATADQVAKVESDVRGLLKAQGFPGDQTIVVRGSAQAVLDGKSPEIGENAIRQLTDQMDFRIPLREADLNKNKTFRMLIDDYYDVPGRGLAVSGFLEQGVVKAGDEVSIIGFNPHEQKANTFMLDICNNRPELLQAGDYASLVLRGVNQGEVVTGQILCKPGSLKAAAGFTARVRLLAESEGGQSDGVYNNDEVQFHLGACEVAGEIGGLPGGRLQPGESGVMKVTLYDMVGIIKNQKIAIRMEGHTIGFGVIDDVLYTVAPKVRRVETESDEADS